MTEQEMKDHEKMCWKSIQLLVLICFFGALAYAFYYTLTDPSPWGW